MQVNKQYFSKDADKKKPTISLLIHRTTKKNIFIIKKFDSKRRNSLIYN